MSKSFNVGQKSNPNYGNKNDNTKQMGNRSFYQNKNVPNQINPITPVNEPMPEMDIPKPSGKCRLFVANIINDISEEDFKNIFKDYGEATDVFVSNKGFGFIKLESKAMAEKAKCDLDGLILNNKILRVRISTSGTALKVLNLSQHATNETLLVAFSIFGPLDRAVVIADERGKSTGEAIVEFSRKNNCQMAMKKINEGVFLVTGSMRPVVVEPYETQDNDAGVSEKSVMKTPEYLKEMSQSPKFAPPGTFEYDYGNKWKALYQQEKIQRELLEKKIQEDREVLENDMENTLHEHQTMMLRQDLMRRQEELRRMEEGIAQFKKNKDGSGQNRDNFYQGNFNSYQQNYSQSNVPFPNQMNPMNMNQDMSQARPMFKPHEQFPIPVQDTVRQKDTENHQSNRSSTENQDQS
ncbi:paraspeckle component 1-like isoform X3 [Gordionus sp. m RMFG-2023]|uniref:paraspeckle component 1-like isoform X3 n=1 Tax=Gordionus sp. m RMFG-2023 TaxID=3053472 RepID=UPI0031FC69CF